MQLARESAQLNFCKPILRKESTTITRKSEKKAEARLETTQLGDDTTQSVDVALEKTLEYKPLS